MIISKLGFKQGILLFKQFKHRKVIKKILSKENHEADILKQLNHPNITNLIKIFADKFFTYLVFEYYQVISFFANYCLNLL